MADEEDEQQQQPQQRPRTLLERQIDELLLKTPSLSRKRPASSLRLGDDDTEDDIEIVDDDTDDDDQQQRGRPAAKRQKTAAAAAAGPSRPVVTFVPTKLYADVLEEKLSKKFEEEQPPRLDLEGKARQMEAPDVNLDEQLLEEIREENDEANGYANFEAEKRRAVKQNSLTCKVCRITEAIKMSRTDGKVQSAYREALNLYPENVLEMNANDLYRAIALKFNETCGAYDKNVTKQGISLWKPSDVEKHFAHKFDNLGSLKKDIERINNDIAQCRQTLWGYLEIDGVRQPQKVMSDKATKDLLRLAKLKTEYVKTYEALVNMGRTIGGGRPSEGGGGGGRTAVLRVAGGGGQSQHGKNKSVHSQAANASLGQPQDPLMNMESNRKKRSSTAHNNISLQPYSDPGFT